jgi:hypothetical protein
MSVLARGKGGLVEYDAYWLFSSTDHERIATSMRVIMLSCLIKMAKFLAHVPAVKLIETQH